MKNKRLFDGLFRKKTYVESEHQSKFSRCLNTFDLTLLGIGTTLGAGVYVVTGEVSKVAGPALIISFIVAAVVCIMAGLCYAEFGARVPRSTGSAYMYSYIAVGELMAFVIGWNMILEYIIGTASVARALTSNLDAVTGHYINTYLNNTFHMGLPGFSEYLDLFSLSVVFLITVFLAIGVKESSRLNNLFTILNLLVILVLLFSGFWNADIKNWSINPKYVNTSNLSMGDKVGNGYFFPFGISGMLQGAGTCFYAFIGFDTISTTGEEVKDPVRSIPIAIILCLTVCCVVYASASSVLTLISPYYLIDASAPFPHIFNDLGWHSVEYIVGYGSLFGLSASLFGAMFPLPRIIYAMANDGLLFSFLKKIHGRFKTPFIATILSGGLSGVLSAIFDLKALVDMMSIGTLLAFTLVALSILLLRFSDEDTVDAKIDPKKISFSVYKTHLFGKDTDRPNRISSFIAKLHAYVIFVLLFVINILLINLESNNQFIQIILIICTIFILLVIVTLSIIIALQPENPQFVSFKVPLMPWVSLVSMSANIHLMMRLPIETWYRFIVWMIIGGVVYFGYGFWHSNERNVYKSELDAVVFSKEKDRLITKQRRNS